MRELRVTKDAQIELRADGDRPSALVGYGAVFNRLSQNLGGFVEEVDAAAFDTTLTTGRDILGAVNHDLNWLIGTTESGTLTVETDDIGLRYEMALDLADPDAVRLAAKVKAGKMRGSSFSFATREDDWSTTDQGFPLRRLLAVELYELGPVASPAYLSTKDGDAATALRSLSKFVDLPFEQIAEAAHQGTLTDLIRRDVPEPVEAPEPPVDNQGEDKAVRTGRRNPPTR